MPDKINIAGLNNFLKSNTDISANASKFSSNSTFAHNNDYVVDDYVKNSYAEEIKKAKDATDAAYATTGHTDEEAIDNTQKSNFWTGLFNTAKANLVMANPGLAAATSMGMSKSVEQIKDEVTSAFYQNKAFDRALKNGIVKTVYDDGTTDKHSLAEDKNYMDNSDMLDNLKYAIGIEENKLGGKKLSISNGSLTDWFYYLDKDEDGKDILSRAPIKDKKKFQDLGKTVLNAYGAVPLFKGGLREFAGQVSNTYSGLAENLVNVNRAATNLLADTLPENKVLRDYANKVTDYSKQFTSNMEVQQSQTGVGSWVEKVAGGTGQGLASMGQMAILGAATGMLGEAIAPSMSAAGKLEAITNFGAGSILNFNEAYKSALTAGLSESKAASIGALTGAVNGLIESAVGTNRLFNWMSGGGDRAISRHILSELGEDVSASSINRVFNNVRRGLTGNAAEYLNKAFEMPVIGTALEEATEEFLQTYSQKSVENLYDAFLAGDKQVGKGKFGTKVFSKDTFSEAIESAMYGAILGAGGDIVKSGSDKIRGKSTDKDSEIIPLIAEGRKAEVEAVIKSMHSSRVITDTQKDAYLDRINHLDDMFKSNSGTFSELDKQTDRAKANTVKGQALGLIAQTFNLSKTNENLQKRAEQITNDRTLTDDERKNRLSDIAKTVQNNQATIQFLNQELNDNYKPISGKIPAYEQNYNNPEEVMTSKIKKFNASQVVKSVQTELDAATAEHTQLTEYAQNPIPSDATTPKEFAEKIARAKTQVDNLTALHKAATNSLQEEIDNFNHITSQEYQDKRAPKPAPTVESTPVEAEPVVTTPIESTPENAVPNNENTQADVENAPVVQRQQLEDEYAQLDQEIMNNPNLDEETSQKMTERMNEINFQLEDMDKANAQDETDYKEFTKESILRTNALTAANLDTDKTEEGLGVIKKDIEQVLAGFKAKGIDTTQLEKAHAIISSKLLDIRDKKAKAAEAARVAAEPVKVEPVTATNFFNRLQRLSFMNNDDQYWTDQEVSDIFAGNHIKDILDDLSIELVDPADIGYTAGQKLGGSMSAMVPKNILTIVYNDKIIGHINMTDGFESNDPGFFNLDQNAYNETILKQNLLVTLLKTKDEVLLENDLKAIGFNFQWNGQFDVDESVPRKVITDFAPAKIASNNNKTYVYDRVRKVEITDGTKNMRNEPGVPPIPEALEERYVILVQAKNGKYYWATAQNQILDQDKQTALYKSLFDTMNEIKGMTDPEEIKNKVSEFNRALNDNIFVSVPYASLSLTTPNATNKKFTLQLKVKGEKSRRVVLDAAKYGNMSDLVNGLSIKSSNLRTAIPLTANTNEVLSNLSVNLTDNVVKNDNLHNSVTFSFDTNKLEDAIMATTIVGNPMTDEDVPNTTIDPFSGYEARVEDNPEIEQDAEIKALEIVPEGTEDELVDPPLLDLTHYDPAYADLSESDKARISAQAEDLLRGYDQLNKLKKRGVDDKIKDLINSYKSSSDPVFSMGEAEEVMDYPEAVNWLQSKLPTTVKIEDINNLLGNIKNNGITFGAFANDMIYLNTKMAAKGTQYHEAFHSVFRMFLTNKQIEVALNVAKAKYGMPTKADLDALRDSSSVYSNYKESMLTNLWLEEKMADDFKKYVLQRASDSKLGKLWSKITDFFKFMTGNMDQVHALFHNINRGKFKNATRQSNVFGSKVDNDSAVFSIFKRGVDENGNTLITTQLEGQAIVAILTNKYIQAIKSGVTDRKGLLDSLIEDRARFYSIDDNPFYADYLESEGKADDDAAIDELSAELALKRAVFTLPENIAALKKDVLKKSQLFDIEEIKTNEEHEDNIDDQGERHDVAVWTIGGETSFSKVLRTYISLVTIDTVDKYGQKTEEAVDFKKVYRGLIRSLAGIEEDELLPRMKAMAEFDKDINAVYNTLIGDLGLTTDGNLNAQDITSNYDLWRKFVTAFNNEKVGWYTVLHSDEQSRLIESNNATAKDLQFNDWHRDFSITFQDLDYDEAKKREIFDKLDDINRAENIHVTTFDEAKAESEKIRQNFKAVNISLSNAYLTYSLFKNSDYSKFDDKAKSFYDSFAGQDGLFDNGNIPFIVSEFKSGHNPFETSRDDKGKERGAVTRLKTIADQNAVFDPTVGDSSFQNADGKNVYSIIKPSFGLVKLRWLSNSNRRAELLAEEATKKDDFISPNGQVLNHLLADPNADIIFNNLNPSMIDGYRRTRIEGDLNETDDEEGVTFGKFDAKQYLLTDMLMFLSNRKSLNKVDPKTGKLEKLGETAMFNINQMEASSTGYGVFLPVHNFKTVSNEALDILHNYFLQEVARIKKVREEFGKEGTKVWLGYNDKKTGRGFKLTEFAGYGLEEHIDKDDIEGAKQLIKAKLEQDIAAYKETLKSNNIHNNLPYVELEKQGFKVKGQAEVKFDELVNDFYLNSYINTLGINNLLLDNYAKKVKNSVDWFKRAKGIIGSGPDMGKGTTIVGVYEEPVKYINTDNLEDIDKDKLVSNKEDELNDGVRSEDEIKQELDKFKDDLDKGKIMIADAQSYVTLQHKMDQLKTWGRFPRQVEDIYNKIAKGETITWKEKVTLEANNAALNSTKTVAYNGDYYFKLSELVLGPSLVGEVGEDGNVIMNEDGTVARPKKGFEYLFNKYNAMVSQGVHQVLPLSASKMATITPAKFAKDGKFDFTGHTMEIENKFKRLQVETPSGKTHVIHGTQLIQLVHSEQDDNMPIDFHYNEDIKTLGDLRNYYRQLLADNRLAGFKQALAYVKDPLSGNFDSKELTAKFYTTVLEGGSDEVMANFFAPGTNGERQFNWNLGPVLNKAEQLFLAHFSKGVLSQKVSGLKVSLVSDTGILIKDKETGEMRSLKHMVKDEDGNYYSECLLPPFAEELLGSDPSDDKVKEVLKMFGVRIPTQDKHSMMSLKVVGFLPMEYGSVGVFAKEIVYLSGADFDIDSEFIHRPDFYVAEDGKLTPYGTAKDDVGKYREFVEWNKENNKMLSSKLKTMDEREAFRAAGLPGTFNEFMAQKPANIGTNDNAMLSAQVKFLTNDYVRNRAATIPSSMDSIKAVDALVKKTLNNDTATLASPNTPLARYNANRNNMEGSAGIGPVALSNVAHALLSTSDVQLLKTSTVPTIDKHTPTGYSGIYTVGSTTDRKNDNISTLLSAMTDNAKEQLARALNLSFNNLPTDTLPVASYMLSIGYTMEESMLFLNLPSIKAFTQADYKLEDEMKAGNKKFKEHLLKEAKDTGISDDQFDDWSKRYIMANTPSFSKENMLGMLNYNSETSDVHDILALNKAKHAFDTLKQHASYAQAISGLMSLNKGMASTFEDNQKFNKNLERLQLLEMVTRFVSPNTLSNQDLLNKLVEAKFVVKDKNGVFRPGDKWPKFKVSQNNPDSTPFDARLAIINDPNTLQNIIIHKQVMDVSKQFFLLNTPVFAAMRNMSGFPLKDLIPHFMDRAYRNYMQILYPEKFTDFAQASDNAGYMIHNSGINSIGRDLTNLQKDPHFKQNLLIKLLTLKNPPYNSKIVQIEFPTRIKAEGDFYTNLNNAFKELFMNPQTTAFARKLYYYSYFKNGLQFKNKSFINTIPSWVFKDVSGALDVLNEDFKDRNFDEYSSLEKSVEATIGDMLTAFSRVSSLAQNLNKYPSQSFYSKIVSTSLTGNVTKVSLKNIANVDTTSFNAYIKSLENLATGQTIEGEQYDMLIKANEGSLKYEIASFIKDSPLEQQSEYVEPNVIGMKIKSIRAFDNLGFPKEMTMNEVIKYQLDNGSLPTAFEINYDRVTTIKESGLTSTVIDNSFLDNYQTIVKSIKKDEKTVEPDYMPQMEEDQNIPDQPQTPTIEESPFKEEADLHMSDNNSIFVNPFEGAIDDGSTVADLDPDIANYMKMQDESFDMDEMIDQMGDINFEDDSDLPIC